MKKNKTEVSLTLFISKCCNKYMVRYFYFLTCLTYEITIWLISNCPLLQNNFVWCLWHEIITKTRINRNHNCILGMYRDVYNIFRYLYQKVYNHNE